jgi:hypothetical protein
MFAELMFGAETFLAFAEEIHATDPDPGKKKEKGALHKDTLRALIRDGLTECAAAQAQVQADADPVDTFLSSLRAALASGRAHATTDDDKAPQPAGPWGWTRSGASGDRIGWVVGRNLYLIPEAAYAAVRDLVEDRGESLPSAAALWSALKDRGLIRTEPSRPDRTKVRVQIAHVRHHVLHLAVGSVVEHQTRGLVPEEPDHTGPSGPVK